MYHTIEATVFNFATGGKREVILPPFAKLVTSLKKLFIFSLRKLGLNF